LYKVLLVCAGLAGPLKEGSLLYSLTRGGIIQIRGGVAFNAESGLFLPIILDFIIMHK